MQEARAILGKVYSSDIRFRKILLFFPPGFVLKTDNSTNAFSNPPGVGCEENKALYENKTKLYRK